MTGQPPPSVTEILGFAALSLVLALESHGPAGRCPALTSTRSVDANEPGNWSRLFQAKAMGETLFSHASLTTLKPFLITALPRERINYLKKIAEYKSVVTWAKKPGLHAGTASRIGHSTPPLTCSPFQKARVRAGKLGKRELKGRVKVVQPSLENEGLPRNTGPKILKGKLIWRHIRPLKLQVLEREQGTMSVGTRDEPGTVGPFGAMDALGAVRGADLPHPQCVHTQWAENWGLSILFNFSFFFS